MPQGEENAPKTAEEQAQADFLAGWDGRFGPAPFEHGLPVDALETTTTEPGTT